MSSGITIDWAADVGDHSIYHVGHPWASGEASGTRRTYAYCGWAEDAGPGPWGHGFRPLAKVIQRVLQVAAAGYFPERRDATVAALVADPWRRLRWEDGHDWTMAAAAAAYTCLGSGRATDGLLRHPSFREAWEAQVHHLVDGGAQ